MTFQSFILNKKPLWVDQNLRLTVKEMIAIVGEWQEHQNNRTMEEKKRDAVNGFPKLNEIK